MLMRLRSWPPRWLVSSGMIISCQWKTSCSCSEIGSAVGRYREKRSANDLLIGRAVEANEIGKRRYVAALKFRDQQTFSRLNRGQSMSPFHVRSQYPNEA